MLSAVDPHLAQPLTILFLSSVDPEASCPWPPSTESPGTKASHRPPTPMQPCPWLPSANLGTGVGSQTEDALRARAQSWRAFLSAMKGQTVLGLNMNGRKGVHAQRPHWGTIQASLCKASPVLKKGVNEDPVWVNRQTLTSYRGEENGAVSLPRAAFPPSSVTQ